MIKDLDAPERIDTITYGERRPLDPGHVERAWAANRRGDGQVPFRPSSR